MIRETTVHELNALLGKRPKDAHKGIFGRVLLVCGSQEMAGAAVLCAKATLRSGAGLVTVSADESLFPIIQTSVPEAMCISRRPMEDREYLESFDAIAAGCGMGAGEDTYTIVKNILDLFKGPVIIDADGINALCAFGSRRSDKRPEDESHIRPEDDEEGSILKGIGRRREAPIIMTPHPGEADRMLSALGCGRYKDMTRVEAAETLAEMTGAVIVLKGHESLIAFSDGKDMRMYINRTGNPGMATGGSGDVLTGVITAMTARFVAFGKNQNGQGDPVDWVRSAVYMHGSAGDLAAHIKGEDGMISTDIAEELPAVFKRITGR